MIEQINKARMGPLKIRVFPIAYGNNDDDPGLVALADAANSSILPSDSKIIEDTFEEI